MSSSKFTPLSISQKKKTTDNTSAASRTPDPAAASRSSAAESVKSGHPASGGVPHSHLIPDQRARGRRHAADLLLRGQPRGEEDVGAGAHGRRDDRVVAFRDINPSAFRHFLVIPIDHIPTVNSLRRTKDDHQLVSHMVRVGKDLLNQDAPNSEEHRFGFHQPPFNSVDHLHLHCLTLPFMPSWRQVKYTPLGPLGGFIEAEKLLERIKPEAEVYS